MRWKGEERRESEAHRGFDLALKPQGAMGYGPLP